MKPYEVLSRTDQNGYYFIELTEGDFKGIIYSFGGVELIEEGDHARLKYDYVIEDKEDYPNLDVKAFEHFIGDILVDMITEGLALKTLVYKGGVDEN